MESFVLCSSSSSSTTSLIPYTRNSLSKRTPFLFKHPLSISQTLSHQPTNNLRFLSSSSTHFVNSHSHLLRPKSSVSPPKPNNSIKPIQSSSSLDHKKQSNSTLQGAKLVPLALSISVGLIIRFLVPKPVELSTQAWQLLAIFLSTNVGLILGTLPIGAWAFLSLTTSVLTKTLTFSDAFVGFNNEVIWLIVTSFFFARGVVKTGLGDRIATYFVKWFGKSALGLSYGLTIGETLVASTLPSTIARAGGVFMPIIESTLLLSAGSMTDKLSVKKLGAYLIQSQLQSAGHSSALFLTAAANNLLCLKLAEELGIIIASPWVTWFKAASVPALVGLLVTPYILYKIFPPGTVDTLDAPAVAALKLEQMGSVKKNEWVMMGTMLLTVSLWIFGEAIGVSSVVAAMLGLCILLLFDVVNWDDCLSDKAAWDTLTWFAVLVGMASQLTNLGIVAWMSNCVANFLQAFSLSRLATFGVLHAAYFFIHYIFASQAAHIGALYSSFLAMLMAAGVPGVLAALSLAYNTSLFGALTHYSSAQAAAYYGAGYVDVPDCFKLGFIMAIINVVIWGVVGTLWWRYLGLF